MVAAVLAADEHDDREGDRDQRTDAGAAQDRQDQGGDRHALAGLGGTRHGGVAGRGVRRLTGRSLLAVRRRRPVAPRTRSAARRTAAGPLLAVAAGRARPGSAWSGESGRSVAGGRRTRTERRRGASEVGRGWRADGRAPGRSASRAAGAVGEACRTGSAGRSDPAACRRRQGSAVSSSGSPRVPPWSVRETAFHIGGSSGALRTVLPAGVLERARRLLPRSAHDAGDPRSARVSQACCLG